MRRPAAASLVWGAVLLTIGLATGVRPGRSASAAGGSDDAKAELGVARLAAPAGAPAPSGILAWPDTVAFGAPIWIAIAWPDARPPATLRVGEEWAAWEQLDGATPRRGEGKSAGPPPGWPPRASGAKLAGRLRAYRQGPLQIGWGEGGTPASRVVTVRPGVAADASPAPVRDPRGLGWRRQPFIWLGSVALLALLALLRARHRRRVVRPLDAPLRPPAYLAAARALWALQADGLPERGEGRRYLDRLAGAVRRYLHDRYRVPAEVLAPDEIGRELTALGHASPLANEAERLLRTCDERRYAPVVATPDTCQAALAQAVALLAHGRVPARFTPVPAALAVEGEAAWARLSDLARAARPGLHDGRKGGHA